VDYEAGELGGLCRGDIKFPAVSVSKTANVRAKKDRISILIHPSWSEGPREIGFMRKAAVNRGERLANFGLFGSTYMSEAPVLDS
jgi:hypothetical protein